MPCSHKRNIGRSRNNRDDSGAAHEAAPRSWLSSPPRGPTNLSDSIEANLPGLIDDWTEYAHEPDSGRTRLSDQQLCNSACDLLRRIVADMCEGQTSAQQHAKSWGDRAPSESGFNEAAHEHVNDRLSHGFDINDLVAGCRALCASVLCWWQQDLQAHTLALQEMIQFNEAIDQMLTESVRQHAKQTERIHDLFTGVLAHGLRSPLDVTLASTETLLHDDSLSSRSVRAVAFIQRGAMRVQQMIDGLLVFTYTRLGDLLPTSFGTQDTGRLCTDAIGEVCASYPDATIDLCLTGELRGKWGGSRIGQLLVNLLANTVRYGSGRVAIEAAGRDGQMAITVLNEDNSIPPSAFPTLFDPLTRATRPDQSGSAADTGLGLYICRRIVEAYRGMIDV